MGVTFAFANRMESRFYRPLQMSSGKLHAVTFPPKHRGTWRAIVQLPVRHLFEKNTWGISVLRYPSAAKPTNEFPFRTPLAVRNLRFNKFSSSATGLAKPVRSKVELLTFRTPCWVNFISSWTSPNWKLSLANSQVIPGDDCRLNHTISTASTPLSKSSTGNEPRVS